ncbi:SMUG2 DNA glycosylase family protein [Chitinophaga sedimenti]|uniref:SMUG2 DNA glycosylase family protein n=1 Tax=Chitinophaga sedimenti TaxID=2033606 RepID=UPI0020049DBA|nr:SMUG2 DNA glycosylase family protein [Chitinophaga sedimenti]MCK7557286.1 SMUG2 DNA glycosylase family protein [Chitinophaga sedimenti]
MKKHTFAEQVIAFNRHLEYTGSLPPGIRIMNPFREQPQVMDIMQQFYRKYYSDQHPRRMIMGINPGRLGSGATGIPFTDTKRLADVVGIRIEGIKTHEPSSVFVYDVIEAYGGPEAFYHDFYFASVSPLGFTSVKPNGSEINYNYYDSKPLTIAVYDFMVKSIRQQLEFGIDTKVCYCFGTGKNAAFLTKLNETERFFEKIVPLEHPRFIMQYRLKRKSEYIDKYLAAFAEFK